MDIVTWEYYNSHFPKLTEEEFNNNVYSATRLVLKKIKSYDQYTNEEQTDIKDCICNVINYQSVSQSQKGVSSVSNDGYSVSYTQKEEKTVNDDIESIINQWIGNLIDWYIGY